MISQGRNDKTRLCTSRMSTVSSSLQLPVSVLCTDSTDAGGLDEGRRVVNVFKGGCEFGPPPCLCPPSTRLGDSNCNLNPSVSEARCPTEDDQQVAGPQYRQQELRFVKLTRKVSG